MNSPNGVRYELLGTCPHTKARRGRLHTPHGTVETPFFMPVGTQGTVKTVGSEDIEALGFEQILSNTYHLSLRPGSDLIERLNGLHNFMSWKGAILTDSGGYQVMSLSKTNEVTDEGVTFKSHLDGSKHFLTPERSIQIQAQLGVDISMMLDQCPPYPCSRDEAHQAMKRTHEWAHRNLAARKEGQAIFGIVQGGVHFDMREESAAYISDLPFDGIAIGGVCVGEPTEMQYPVVEHTAPLLPKDKARYLMGVGHPKDILHAVASAKVLNMTTNLAALALFGWAGHVWWQFMIPMAVANVVGSHFGARLAVSRGSGFIRLVFIAVVAALILKSVMPV